MKEMYEKEKEKEEDDDDSDNLSQDHFKIPFFAWNCISIETKHRVIDIVISDD